MAGIYEILEWVMHEQPKTPICGFAFEVSAVGPLTGATQIYAILSSCTSGEARSLVQQARGFQAAQHSLQSQHDWAAESGTHEDHQPASEHAD